MRKLVVPLVLLIVLALVGQAVADDWVAVKLRGKVLQLVDGQWEALERGAVVPDSRVIRTLGGGRVTFERGGETIELGGDTQIQIHDEQSRRPFTTVKQYFGEVTVEAEVKDVKHFAVQTPYLVAVVKGTRFSVRSDEEESRVKVKRGSVAVNDREYGSRTTVTAGQSATVEKGETVQVAGRGDLPVVLDKSGEVIVESRTVNFGPSLSTAAEIRGNSGDHGNRNGNGNSGNGWGNSTSGNGNGNSGNGNGNGGGDGNSGNGGNGNGNSGNDNGNGGGDGNSGNGGNGNSQGNNR